MKTNHAASRLMRHRLLLAAGAVALLMSQAALSADDADARSSEAELAMQGFRLPSGMRVELFAAEPLLANPVAFCIDEQGRFLVAETYRQGQGVEDNRDHMDWLHDDLSLQTVEDRLEMFRKHLGDKIETYDDEQDLLRMVEDRDGDGRADHYSVFAEGFNGILEGTGAGVLSRRGQVYYTCIPKLWSLRDADGDGQAEQRTALHHGYGVRVAFRGHDSHGLRFGPDGRLYFSIGDRGFHIETDDGRTLARPDTGAVFRCNPDGSELEVFAFGLRNPQELAFDEFGNLFTGENNSDSGDKARWVYVAEGGDTGWRMYYQYLPDRGPWNREKLWHPQHAGQAAYIVPPIANLGDGPSGLVYYPGVGLSKRYQGHFFLCDFRGTAGVSGIRSFAVQPKGAFFELTDSHEFIWSILATDVDFGYDGSMYATDWVHGWYGPAKGRIYKFTDPKFAATATQAGAAAIMRDGFIERSESELAELLLHADIRVRQEAQFALAEQRATATLAKVAASSANRLARLHGIWGLGQIGRQQSSVARELLPLIEDQDAEVRAQTAKVLGEADLEDAYGPLVECLSDAESRVRFFAAMSLGKLGRADAVPQVLQMLAENNDRDPMLRHAGVMALTGIADEDELLAAANHPSSSARMGVLLALRRLESRHVALFLRDAEPALIVEAARAINDQPIESAQPALAALAGEPGQSAPLLRRVLNANYRLGGREHAKNVVTIAANDETPEQLRIEALEELSSWGEPHPLDRVLGSWRPLEERESDFIADTLSAVWGSLFAGPDPVRSKAADLAAALGVSDVAPLLLEVLTDSDSAGQVRADALSALGRLDAEQLPAALDKAVVDRDAVVRSAARRWLAQTQPQQAVSLLSTALESGETVERQQAIDVLASLELASADQLLSKWLDRLIAGEVSLDMRLDLIEAAQRRGTDELKQKLGRFEATRKSEDPLALYGETLAGGDAERGREIFFGRSELSCLRCHKVSDRGGDVGPDLSKIGREKNREYLLESIVLPSKQIAKGFETAVIVMESGKVLTGIVKSEEGDTLRLMLADGNVQILAKSEIDERATGTSAMPVDLLQHLSKRDLRDLVEYLSTLKLAD